MKTKIFARFGVAAAVAVFALSMVPAAFAVFTPITVSDDVTHVKISKFETGTHEWVEGAHMAIIEKDTQEVVAEWITGAETFVLEKKLDVDTPYILKELAAPAGYALAQDVEFYVNASEAEGITLVDNGGEGNAEQTDSITIAVYDVADDAIVTETQTQRGETTTIVNTRKIGSSDATAPSASRVAAPKTGDETPLYVVAVVAAVAVVGIIVLQVVKRRRKTDE